MNPGPLVTDNIPARMIRVNDAEQAIYGFFVSTAANSDINQTNIDNLLVSRKKKEGGKKASGQVGQLLKARE